MYTRMTDYSLEDLRKMVSGADSMHCGNADGCDHCSDLPIGAVMNEIGIIFLEGNPAAEEDLAKILQEPNSMVAATGYFYLTQKKSKLKRKTLSLVKAFEKNPKNARAVKKVKEKIAELASDPMEA